MRPALDLMGRLDPANGARPGHAIYDLGCGAGNIIAHPGRTLSRARRSSASIRRRRCSPRRAARRPTGGSPSPRATSRISSPAQPPGILYSNAAYQWLEGHIDMFPGLMKLLPSGGQLAIQMPRNHEAPSHALMQKAAAGRSVARQARRRARHPRRCRGAGALLRRAEAALLGSRGLGDDLPAAAHRQGSGGAVHRRHRPAALSSRLLQEPERTRLLRDLCRR